MNNFLLKLKNVLLYAGLDKEKFEATRQDFQRINTSNVRIFSAITAVYMAVLYITSHFYAVSMINKHAYAISLILAIMIFGASFIKGVRNHKAVIVIVHILVTMLFAFGIVISLNKPNQASTSFVVLIMACPLLFYDRPIKIGSIIVVCDIVFIVLSCIYKSHEAASSDVLNGVCFGTLSCLLNTRNLMVRTERIWYGNKMKKIAEIDMLTNMKNRNCYEQSYRSYSELAEDNVMCVFTDVNGLHEINNTYGHEAGDKMLIFVANQIMNEFGRDDAYRIGGDEYVVMLCDQVESEVQKKIDRIVERVEAENYHISVGIVSAPVENIDMRQLIKLADQKMYEAKKAYYSQIGVDRRR